MAAQWNHTGLQDQFGRARTGLWIWDDWKHLGRQAPSNAKA